MGVRYESNFDAVKKKVNDVAAKKAFAAANTIKNNWVRKLSGAGTGREYTIPGTNTTYTASAPGNPPAVQFGDLLQSPQLQVFEEGGNYGYSVGSHLKYAPMLEAGTYKMKPRPSLKPAQKESMDEIKRIMEREWL